ncbi:MAG TPA: PIG-L family deacetylase [Candidatus Acidoferrales bacterium]|nr:PIG-L family deacetylase [Candidatus Acidoferrales bacterium]
MRCWYAVFVSLLLTGCGGEVALNAPREALIVVSPHPDDESIFGAASIHRMVADPNRYVQAIYISGGDKATVPGDCNGIPEAQKIKMIVALRENETRKAWKVISPDRDIPIAFLEGPDQGLVASSTVVNGIRQDVLSPAGETAVQRAVQIATQLPDSVQTVLFMTTSLYDGHPDHRTAYHAARQAAEILANERHLAVRIWGWIVHDEVAQLNLPSCCQGDFHWPSTGSTDNYLALTDTPDRPRPPHWNLTQDVSDLTDLRHQALAQHVSQVVGYPPLCMPDYIPSFYVRWNQKVEEAFYEEVLSGAGATPAAE